MSHERRDHLKVLVTGASGFVGGRVVDAMLRSGIAEPVAGVRSWSRAARVARAPVEIAVCDIMDADAVRDTVSRVNAIVHCAYTDDPESITRGTRHLLEAAATRGIERFVYLSSAEVYGPETTGDVDENCDTPLTGRAYGDAKIEAESLCRQYADRGISAAILRPSLIYGPFGRSWTINIAKRLQSGGWAEFDSFGEGLANLVYVDDLVQAILRAVAKPQARGETFNVNGPQQPSWNEYFRLFNEALGLRPLARMSSSRSRWRTATLDVVSRACYAVRGRFDEQLMRIYLQGGWRSRMMKRLKGVLDASPSGDELHGLYARRAVYRDDKIRTLLGYQPQFDLKDGLALSAQWLRHHGYTLDAGVELGTDEPMPRSKPGPAARPIEELEEAVR
ncbi:MAG: NAD(P)-dependent oxidoreductase [Planctomycetaceae bacterium]|nr:NAD(P)-dependent oxidoreductase [Planctomycetaceae bacterium]